MAKGYAKLIEGHYAAVWPGSIRRRKWSKGPVHELPPDFTVLVSRVSSDMLAYSTCCMSQPDDQERLELHLFTSSEDAIRDDLVELLTVVAHYHRTGASLGLHHTVNFGRGWQPGSRCTHGLLSLPYLHGPALEWMEDPLVRFLWLIPVTESEVAFKKQHGIDALEEQFEVKEFNFLDPRRVGVA